jgi:hypothetical protein
MPAVNSTRNVTTLCNPFVLGLSKNGKKAGVPCRMKILLLGSTGSIGSSACQCIRRCSTDFTLVGVSTNTNVTACIAQIREFSLSAAYVGSPQALENARKELPASV